MDDFGDFVAARGPALWRAAWLLTGDGALAEDLLQTALTRAWPHFGRVSRNGSFEAYVRRTLFTTADTLGCSVGSVKTHHRRALAALRTSPLLAETVLSEEAR